jgi:hypothetical protein
MRSVSFREPWKAAISTAIAIIVFLASMYYFAKLL